MLQIEEAVALLQSRIAPLKETERISLTEALGRITAVDYTAQYDQPPFPRSPLDGYAVQGEDSLGASKESPMTLKVVGKIYAGEMFFRTIRKGEALRPGKIYDSNRFYVSSRLTELGTPPFLSQHCPDDAAIVTEAIRQAAKTCDLIITTGGVSVGEKDILHEVLRLLGAEQLFWKVALKPGSPTLAAVYHRVPIVCLPGNHSCNLYQ